ncbi:hypothetical protein RJ639_043813 [Escallonia herrerae]|uniref:Uncharacterized protein n=1 Tax=Escallonia herrerae TaxID=1293975 RepID=A0AA89B8X6_9ASTE|nr:hypothetical protein RJ639_043813 [Escallonia herrerae]
MEREGKGIEGEVKKLQFKGKKWKPGVLIGKIRGNSTPSPTWNFGCLHPDGSLLQDFKFPIKTTHSARQLGANFWEVHPPHPKMSKGGARHHHHNYHKDKGLGLPKQLAEPPDGPTEKLASQSKLKGCVSASQVQHDQSIKRDGHALQPVYTASYSSSVEDAPYIPAVTPTTSLDFEHMNQKASYSLKTSTELLKVLNRIWSLEKQHASNILNVKALKRELNHSQARLKELLQEKKRDRVEIDDLMKQIKGNEVFRKKREQDRIKAVTDELEDERKLRKHSENIHRKLGRELSEVRSSFSNALKELKGERKAQILLENFCDELAKGIRDYEQELRLIKHKTEKDLVVNEHSDQLILHISEAWLDERLQMKLAEGRADLAENNSAVDKLSSEIQRFLHARQSDGTRNNGGLLSKMQKGSSKHKRSLESFHLTEAASAPHDGNYDENSSHSGTHCFDLYRVPSGKQRDGFSGHHCKKASESHSGDEIKSMEKKTPSAEVFKACNQSCSQMQFEEHGSGKVGVENPNEVDNSQKLERSEITAGGSKGRENRQVGAPEMDSYRENKCMEGSLNPSASTGNAGTVRQWISSFTAPDPEVSESSSKWPPVVKENTLKAKLLEARLESQRSRSKASKGHI